MVRFNLINQLRCHMKNYILLLLALFLSNSVFSQTQKSYDGHVAYCDQQKNINTYAKFLNLKVVSTQLTEDIAKLQIFTQLSSGCDASGWILDKNPSLAGTLKIEKYILTVALPTGELLHIQDLMELLITGAQALTIELPKSIVTEKQSIEIGVQIFGHDSQNDELMNPVSDTFGVFTHRF